MKRKIKITFRVKLYLILVSTVLMFIVVSQVLSLLLLTRFYMSKKEAEILTVYKEVTEILAKGASVPNAEDGISAAITDLSQKNNDIILLSDKDFNNAFSLMPVSAGSGAGLSGGRAVYSQRVNFVNTYMKYVVETYFPEPADKPRFAKIDASAANAARGRPMQEPRPGPQADDGFLCMFTPVTLADGADGYLLLQTSLPAINLNVQVTNEFVWIISLIILAIGLPTMFFLAGSFSRPISEISDAAKKIAELDFRTKLRPRGNDEISDLAENVNCMSDKLKSAVSELTEANEKLIKKERLGKELLANVSHELKTPISLVGGYAEGLKLNVAEEDKNYYCGVIIDEAAKMSRLVND
ncbi:MAG: HAMP domain-containing protein, partial [Firmicutes bacterium]|nr:HAMP domain-containing protein [Bacillota bacterium]